MFFISDQAIDPQKCLGALRSDRAGARVVFEGLVRNHSQDQLVESLEYEVFDELALAEGASILREAVARFELLGACAYHRRGHLSIGDLAVWVGAIAAHRQSAFGACRYIIDELKQRLPIWKKEHYRGGRATWLDCQGCKGGLSEELYYERQARLPEFAAGGQDKLRKSRVLVIGAGGLGAPALSYLAAAGVGEINVWDGDRLEASNLHRQLLYSSKDIGTHKVLLAKGRLEQLNPFITVNAFPKHVTVDSVSSIVSECDMVLDCCDDFLTKMLVNDACYLQGIPFVSASVYRYEGRLHSLIPGSEAACLRCLWPDIDASTLSGSCTDSGILGSVVGVVGSMQANEAIKYLLSPCTVDAKTVQIYDLMSNDFFKIIVPKEKNCPLCGPRAYIFSIDPANYQRLDHASVDCSAIDCDCDDLIDLRDDSGSSVLGEGQYRVKKVSIAEFDSGLIRDGCKTILVCQTGGRSDFLAKKLRSQGFSQVYSLRGGALALKSRRVGCF